jgi:hypothetical protein
MGPVPKRNKLLKVCHGAVFQGIPHGPAGIFGQRLDVRNGDRLRSGRHGGRDAGG